ncbi:MAG TPA: hypothetical protein VFY14_01780 [Streptomyces sp.]|nr:hypothetical protein [Streptomyces sp.]
MVRREESVPFAFIAESDRFRSNVTPPPQRLTRPQMMGHVLLGLVVVAGIAGSLLLGVPALQTLPDSDGPDRTAVAEGR